MGGTRSVAPAIRLLCVLSALFLLVGLRPAHATQLSATTVRTFYPIIKTEYDKRAADKNYVPIKVSAVPSGATHICFYYAWNGAPKENGYYLVLRHHNGSTLEVIGWDKLTVANGNSAASFGNSGRVWPDGSYDADLVIDSTPVATVHVTVGGNGGSGGLGSVHGVKIKAFFSTSPTALTQWFKVTTIYPLPKATTQFPAGTTETAFCYNYEGGKAKVTTYEVVVHGPNGLVLKGSSTSTMKYASAAGGVYRSPPQHLAYPNGTYTADMLIDGIVAAETTFTVG